MSFDIQKIKEQINITDVYEILEYLDADPVMKDGLIVSRTVSHGGDSKKLYYYSNTQLFVDYTDGGDAFDVFELISKVLNISLNDAIWFVVSFLHIDGVSSDASAIDWDVFDRYKAIDEVKSIEPMQLPELDKSLIDNYPRAVITSWVGDFIPYAVQEEFNIRFNPIDSSILIPHYDKDSRLVGVRKRALVESDIESGKYRPAVIGGILRNHPLAFNLYGLDKAKEAILDSGIAIVAEGEKSVLQSHAYGIGQTVACCGSSLSMYQMKMLLDCGAKEVVIGFDSDYKDLKDEGALQVVSRLMKLYRKISPYAKISFLWDKEKLLGFKDSPFDRGKDVFMHLWRNRVVI